NADIRLTSLSYHLGLAKEDRFQTVQQKIKDVKQIIEKLKQTSVSPDLINSYLSKIGSAPISEKQKLAKIILRPSVNILDMIDEVPALKSLKDITNNDNIKQAEIQIKYQRYIEKEEEIVAKIIQMEELTIPESF